MHEAHMKTSLPYCCRFWDAQKWHMNVIIRKKNSVILTFAFLSHPVIFSTASLTSSKLSLKSLWCFQEVRDFEFSPSRAIELNNELIFAHYLWIVRNQRDFDEKQKFDSVLSN